MSLPIAKLNLLLLPAHSLDDKILATVTVADLRLGTSIPTALLPGIGASILMAVAARS